MKLATLAFLPCSLCASIACSDDAGEDTGAGGESDVAGNGGASANGGASGNGNGGSGNSGNGGSGDSGSANGGTGGNTIAVARGAVSVGILGGVGCPLDTQFLNIPVQHTPPVNASAHDSLLTWDGDEDNSQEYVKCLTLQSADRVLVRGLISLGSEKLPLVEFQTTTRFGYDDSPGSVELASPKFEGTYGSNAAHPCVFSVIEIDAVVGKVWGEVTCEQLTRIDQDDQCVLEASYFYFENCKTTAE